MKDYREKYLVYYVLVLCSGYLLTDTILFSNFQALSTLFGFLISSTIPIIIAETFVRLFDGLLNRNIKQNCISLFGLFPIAGQTIFTNISEGKFDPRVKVNQVKSMYKQVIDNLPEDKKAKKEYENQEWYKIYRRHEDDERITSYNKDYLLSRDMFCQTLEVILLYGILIFLGLIHFSLQYLELLFAFGFITFIGCRVKAKDFVNIVMVVDVVSSN
jgi:hypothetical protein